MTFWYQHYMMLMASSMTPLHSLSQDDQYEVQNYFWSCDAFGTSIGITSW